MQFVEFFAQKNFQKSREILFAKFNRTFVKIRNCLNHFEFADEQELDGLVTEDENGTAKSALPRRMSEVNAATTIQPIPPAASFFIFSQSNRFHFIPFFLSFDLNWFLSQKRQLNENFSHLPALSPLSYALLFPLFIFFFFCKTLRHKRGKKSCRKSLEVQP